ncbi:hypothetical protein BN77_p10656 [Rhizobium mesoamericanum STM3625]|uniref:Uncharacterized protein n=1 Tax=Rhizobium mesoamericanum STM3625 TaxID=1211777 RepID=K0Q680_9HYPH|nr:hypothetical protein BN77_p10656 [Rhizobium mesoamericanum STM3625]
MTFESRGAGGRILLVPGNAKPDPEAIPLTCFSSKERLAATPSNRHPYPKVVFIVSRLDLMASAAKDWHAKLNHLKSGQVSLSLHPVCSTIAPFAESGCFELKEF